jgi:carbon monoxide dehydrogenase subunit G
MKVERKIEIDASPEDVYRLLMDPGRLSDWVSIHAGLEEAPDGELREGSQLTQRLRLAGQRFKVRWTVVEAKQPSRVVWEGKGPVRSKARVVYDLTPNGDGTAFCYSNEYKLPGGPLAVIGDKAVGRTAGREAERSLENLKSLLDH